MAETLNNNISPINSIQMISPLMYKIEFILDTISSLCVFMKAFVSIKSSDDFPINKDYDGKLMSF